MKSIKKNTANLNLDEYGYNCYRFYTDVLGYKWRCVNNLEEYLNLKNDLNELQKIKLHSQKINLMTGNIESNIFEGLGGLDSLEINDQKDISIVRSCIYYYYNYDSRENKNDTIKQFESQVIAKGYKVNTFEPEYIFKKSVTTNELFKIDINTKEIINKDLLTNKVSDIPEQYFNNLPNDFIDLITDQTITITKVHSSPEASFVVYVINK
jgi:hypothetical protein